MMLWEVPLWVLVELSTDRSNSERDWIEDERREKKKGSGMTAKNPERF